MPVDYYPDALDQAASIPPIASALHVAFTSAWTQIFGRSSLSGARMIDLSRLGTSHTETAALGASMPGDYHGGLLIESESAATPIARGTCEGQLRGLESAMLFRGASRAQSTQRASGRWRAGRRGM